SPGSLSPPYVFRREYCPSTGQWVSPFGYPRIEARSAAPRGLSQPPTSFFGIRRQGIHRWLFVAWRTKMLVLAMQFSRGSRPGGRSHGDGRARPAGERQNEPAVRRARGTPSKRNRGSVRPPFGVPREVETYDRSAPQSGQARDQPRSVPPLGGGQ